MRKIDYVQRNLTGKIFKFAVFLYFIWGNISKFNKERGFYRRVDCDMFSNSNYFLKKIPDTPFD